jgi:hypothetical protein
MKLRLSVFGMAAAFSIALGLAAPANAAPIIVTDIEMPKNDVLTVNVPGGYEGGAYVGQFLLTTNTGDIIAAWCIDIYHDTFLGAGQNLTYNLGLITNDSNGVTLTGTQVQEISGLITYGDALLLANGTNDDSAAIQLAIWKIEYPTFTWEGGPIDEVNHLISLAPSLGGSALALMIDGRQTLAVDPVPEPMSIAVLGVALTGLGFVRKRKE